MRLWSCSSWSYSWSSRKHAYIIFNLLKPHFYMVNLGFTGVYIIFLSFAQKRRLWYSLEPPRRGGYSLEPPRRGGSNKYPQSMFWAEIWKISEFVIWLFSVFFLFVYFWWNFLYIWIGVFSYCFLGFLLQISIGPLLCFFTVLLLLLLILLLLLLLLLLLYVSLWCFTDEVSLCGQKV